MNGRPPLSLIAEKLGVTHATAQRLAKTGLVDELASLNRVAAWPQLEPRPGVLVVALGQARRLTPDESEADGGWRKTIGYNANMTAEEIRLASAGWWRAARTPVSLLAIVMGIGVGAWVVEGTAAVSRGRRRFALGDELRELSECRVVPRRGPTAWWLDQ